LRACAEADLVDYYIRISVHGQQMVVQLNQLLVQEVKLLRYGE